MARLPPASIKAFSQDPEGYYFDRKSARKEAGEIAKHLMALANAAGGKLVAGIEDDGVVTGFKRDKAHGIESFEQAHVTELVPSPRVAAERIPVVNAEGESDQVLVMDVACSENQVVRRRKDGKVALRQGDESAWLDYEQIRALEYDKGEYYFDGELTRDLTLEDVDHEALQTYKDALGTAISDEKLLRSKGLLKDGRLTNAGAMLFAEAPSLSFPQTKFRVLKIDGTEMGHGDGLRVVKERTFDGPLVRTLPEARDFIASQLREYQFQLPGRMEFTTVPECPLYPWFEGLVNAIAHRDYTIRGECIRVYIFDGRMEIQSPGSPPNIVTPENGIVTTRGLAENRGITTRTASGVLKRLAARGVLTRRGKSSRDPKQYYEITPKEIS